MRPIPAPTNPAILAARAEFGRATASLIGEGHASRVQIASELRDNDGDAVSIDVRVTVASPSGAVEWRLNIKRAPATIELHKFDGTGAEAEDDAHAPAVVAFACALRGLLVTCDGRSARGNDVVADAGVVDDTIFWDASGGPYYSPTEAVRT